MKIPQKSIFSGIVKFTTIDDHDHLGAILFTGGCNFRCIYCHNPDFVFPNKIKFLEINEIINFLEKKKNLLESITICGGEPTMHPSLIDWIKYIKSLGYRVKLDTNATNQIMLKKILNDKLVDFIAVDYKAPKNKYSNIIQKNFDPNIIIENLKLIINSKIDYEIRTTIHPDLHNENDIHTMIKELKNINIKSYFIQLFKMPPQTVGQIKDKNYDLSIIKKIEIKLKKNFLNSGIRNE